MLFLCGPFSLSRQAFQSMPSPRKGKGIQHVLNTTRTAHQAQICLISVLFMHGSRARQVNNVRESVSLSLTTLSLSLSLSFKETRLIQLTILSLAYRPFWSNKCPVERMHFLTTLFLLQDQGIKREKERTEKTSRHDKRTEQTAVSKLERKDAVIESFSSTSSLVLSFHSFFQVLKVLHKQYQSLI